MPHDKSTKNVVIEIFAEGIIMNYYELLEITEQSTEDEIKTAYKTKYALYISKEKNADELNKAYDYAINRVRSRENNSSSEFADIRRLINAARYEDAELLLDGMNTLSALSEWNYLKGYILYKRGCLCEAMVYAAKAENAVPFKDEYSSLVKELKACTGMTTEKISLHVYFENARASLLKAFKHKKSAQ